jgi:threonine aldolase
MIVNLLSDTVTVPTSFMLESMMRAIVGDDVFGEDPTVNQLERKVADLFGMEAAVFVPSGTMANQIALKAHTEPLDEIICDKLSHIYKYELGGYGFHSGAAIHLIDGDEGKITADQIKGAIKPDVDWYPVSKLVSLENTINMAGGNYYTIEEIKPIQALCGEHQLKLHLDGARLFNALVETGDAPKDYGAIFDSISICFSKGLGAPVGSILIGDKTFIRKSRRIRKAFGGGMRQAGYLAAACIYALDHHVDRLTEDHQRARKIAQVLETLNSVSRVRDVKTNIIIFDVKGISAADFVSKLAEFGIKSAPVTADSVRFVLHLDINDQMVDYVIRTVKQAF